MTKGSNLLTIVLLIISLFWGVLLFLESYKAQSEISGILLAQSTIKPHFRRELKSTTLIFSGDIVLDRGVEVAVEKYGHGDYRFPFFEIGSQLNEADILFGNLEGPISSRGRKVGSIYSFRIDPKAIDGLLFAGFDVLSVANNHIFDYGKDAMEDTFQYLKLAGIDYVGGGFSEQEAYEPRIKEIEGTKIAFLAYTNLGSLYWAAQGNGSGIAWLEKEKMVEGIRLAKDKADVVIVSFHYGNEYQTQPDNTQIFLSQTAIEEGADLIIGHHPHVVQPIEEYKTGFIAYSLGNFVFDQSFSEQTMRGLLLKVIIKNKKIEKIVPIEVEINDFFQPTITQQ